MGMTGVTGWAGPRKVGGRYYCWYWGREYTVVSIADLMTVEWEDGHRTTHCTAWDERRDRIVAEPAVA